jgi:hypothetical protein
VVQSLHPGVAVGERLYGYWPMASSAVLSPGRLSPERFTDMAEHRAALPAVYNQYFRCASDPLYTAGTEDTQALLRPLFITSWLIDDFMADNDFFGAKTMLLSSASSKTAYGTAFQLHQRQGHRGDRPHLAGQRRLLRKPRLLRPRAGYDALDAIAADTPCVYVDFAGNGALRNAIHERFANLKYSSSIGGTHVEQLAAKGAGKDLAGPRATLFFAPAQIKKRTTEWGADEFGRRMVAAWHAFIATVTDAPARRIPGCIRASPWRRRGHRRLCAGARGQGRPAHGPCPFSLQTTRQRLSPRAPVATIAA